MIVSDRKTEKSKDLSVYSTAVNKKTAKQT